MQSIGVSELRTNLSGFLEQVQAGEIIVITSRGQEVARLVPPDLAVVNRGGGGLSSRPIRPMG